MISLRLSRCQTGDLKASFLTQTSNGVYRRAQVHVPLNVKGLPLGCIRPQMHIPQTMVNAVFKRFFSSNAPEQPLVPEPAPNPQITPWKAWKAKFYVPDIRMEVNFLWILGLVLLFSLIMMISKYLQTSNFPLYKKILYLNNEALDEIRVWTPATSIFSLNGEFGNFTSALVVLIYATSNVWRTLGTTTFSALFMVSHVATITTNFLLNWTFLKRVERCKEQIANGEGTIDPTFQVDTVKNERIKLINRMYAERYDLTAKQRIEEEKNLQEMADSEILELASQMYKTRPLMVNGGYLAVAGYFSLLNTYAKFPTKILFPALPMLMMLYAFERRHTEYAFPEVCINVMPSILTAFLFWMATRGRAKIYKWDPYDIKPVAIPNVKIHQQGATKLSSQEIQTMRKRNEKWQKSKKPQDQ